MPPPIFPLVRLTKQEPVTLTDIQNAFGALREGVLLLLFEKTPADAGGYLFPLEISGEGGGGYWLHPLTKHERVHQFAGDDLVRYINHFAGRHYDEAMVDMVDLIQAQIDVVMKSAKKE